MWYKTATKFNIFGLPIAGGPSVKQFSVDENIDLNPEIDNLDQTLIEEPQVESPDQSEEITPEEFTPEDLQQNVEKIENDPTALIKLPPLHENCRCKIETIPYLSQVGFNDGRRIWKRAEECCPVCLKTSIEFNLAETQRLINKIDNLINQA